MLAVVEEQVVPVRARGDDRGENAIVFARHTGHHAGPRCRSAVLDHAGDRSDIASGFSAHRSAPMIACPIAILFALNILGDRLRAALGNLRAPRR